jgi:excisionase family DNA binding protein
MAKVIQLKPTTPDDLMTVRECAQEAQCSKDHIYDLVHSGRLKGYPRGYLKVSLSEALRAMEY